MDNIYYPNGDRVHCGTCLWIKVEGKWQWGRFEVGSQGQGYFVLDGKCCDLDAVGAIDYEKSRQTYSL